MTKTAQGSSFKNPTDSPEFRKALLAEIAASNLSDATKAKLSADINNDDPAKFAGDAGSSMDSLVQGAEARGG